MKTVLIIILSINLFFGQKQYSQSVKYKNLKNYQKLWVEGNIDAAITELNSSPKSNNDLYNLAYLLWVNKDYTNALATINDYLHENQSSFAYLLKGKIYLSQDQTFLALKSLEKAYDIDDSDPNILTELGKSYYKNKNYKKAINILDEALDENEKSSEAAIFLAKSYMAQKNSTKARKLLEENLSTIYPENDYLIVLSDLMLEENKTIKAILYLKQYLDTYPNGSFSQLAHKKLNVLSNPYNPINKFTEMTKTFKIKKNEHLKYIVSYGFDIGQMVIDVGNDTVFMDNKKTFYVSYNLKSTTFLIDLVSHFESYIDVNSLNTVRSYLSNKEGDLSDQKVYIFNRDKNIFIARSVNYYDRIEYVEKDLPLNSQDGTSILYFSRGMMANKLSGKVTTIIKEEFSTTDINIKDTKKEVLNDVNQNFYYLEAKANYSGVAGMTGDAFGYFSMDGNYVPSVGKLKIIVGSVHVELVEKTYGR